MGLNKKFLIFGFRQIIIFQYFIFKLCLFQHFKLWSNLEEYWTYEADVHTRTCLYLIQIYTWNIFLNYGKVKLRKVRL